MTVIDVFTNREYLCGNIYPYNDLNIISSIDPNKIPGLSHYQRPKSGGCCVRFITDSPEVKICYSVTPPLTGNYPHVGISAQRGISCSYRRIKEVFWHNIDCFYSRSDNGEALIQSHRCVENGELYELAVFLPIKCFISGLKIILNDGAAVHTCDSPKHRITVLGGTVGYGLGVSSTHFLLNNLLARHIPESYVTGVSFNDSEVWNCYLTSLPYMEEIDHSEIILLESPYPIVDNDDVVKLVADVLRDLCGKTKGKIILWYKPCYKQVFEGWAPIVKKIILDNRLSSRIFLNERFLLNDYRDFDMYMSSVNFVNDSGNIFIMKQIKEMIQEIWNT